MAEGNNIDDLFRQKLASREVAYSEAGWAGAEQLLDKHYKWLFWKKLGLFLLPVAAVTGSLFFLLPAETEIVDTNKEVKVESQTHLLPSATPARTVESTESSESEVIASQPAAIGVSSSVQADESVESVSAPLDQANADVAESTTRTPESKDGLVESDPQTIGLKKTQRSQPSSSAPQTDAATLAKAASSSAKTNQELFASKNSTIPPVISNRRDMQRMPWSSITNLAGAQNDILDRAGSVDLREHKRKILVVEAHGGLLFSSRLSNSGSQSWETPLGAYAGANVQWFFQPRVSLGMGTTVHSRSGLNSSISQEGNAVENSLAATYADITLDLRVNVIKRHTLGFGIAFAPLIQVYKESETANGSDRSFGRDGFASLDAGGMLYYQFRLSQRLNLDASARIGLFDLTDDDYFGTESVDDRNHQFRLGLSYRLLQR